MARQEEEAEAIAAARENCRYLPGVTLPASLRVTAAFERALAQAALVIVAVPVQRLRQNVERYGAAFAPDATVLCASKGLELRSGLTPSQVIAAALGERHAVLLTLSGPNLSAEIAAGLPAAAVVAGPPAAAGQASAVQRLFPADSLRLYTSDDQAGVELAGALKNVIAIACGIGDGLAYGHNARAALVTRGLAEMTRLTVAAGGRAGTVAGLAGLGDLMTTISGTSSRNYSLGLALGRGAALPDSARLRRARRRGRANHRCRAQPRRTAGRRGADNDSTERRPDRPGCAERSRVGAAAPPARERVNGTATGSRAASQRARTAPGRGAGDSPA